MWARAQGELDEFEGMLARRGLVRMDKRRPGNDEYHDDDKFRERLT